MAKANYETWQPQWVALPILDFVRIVHSFGNDAEALNQWVKKFADDLLFCNTDSEDELTKRVLIDAKEKTQKLSKAGRKGGYAKARNQRQQNSAAPSSTCKGEVNMHCTGNGVTLESGNDAANNKCMVAGNGNAPEDRKSATAMHTNLDGEPEYSDDSDDGKSGSSPSSNIEGAEVGNDSDESANTLEEYHDQETASGNYQVPDKVSTNNGDAARCEAADGETHGNVAAARTTVSNPLALDMPGSDKASDPSGYNTANFPPSEGHEDGTNLNWHDIVQQSLGIAEGYDQETEARESQTGAGAPPVRDPDCHNAPAPRFPRKSKPPKNAEEVRCFAADHAIDVDDARDWYEMNYVDRPGCDKDGVVIENWKGHCTAYCQTMAERRKAG